MQSMLRRLSILAAVFMLIAAVSSAQTAQIPLEDLSLLESGSVLQDSFDEDVTARLYAFQGSAGDFVSVAMVQVDETGSLDPYLLLFAPDGELLASDDDSGSVFLSALIEGVELPSDGTYLVLATSLYYIESTSPDVPEPQDYVIGIEGATAPDVSEISIEALPMAYGDTLSAESTVSNPGVFFAFAGDAGDVVNVLMDSGEFPTLLHLFAPTGERIATDASAISELDLQDEGVYLILATDAFFYEAQQEDGFFIGGEFTLALEGQ